MSAEGKFYVTTSIPYLNASPHLGFALEALQADLVARLKKMEGKEVFFLSGADEHGAKISKAAEAAGMDPQSFVDKKVVDFKKLLKELDISNNFFIRTSDQKQHWPGAQALWTKLREKGDIYKDKYKGLYCLGHEAFVTDKDLDDRGYCALHKSLPQSIEEENYFFRLTNYTEQIHKNIEAGLFKILPASKKNEVLNMLKDAEDVSFSRPSRDLPWGVPVPGDASQTMYVWCDALSNYITALGYGSGNLGEDSLFKKFWPADIHVIGKDILRFHALLWPAMLLSAGLALPKKVFVHGFINSKGEKMSKSLGNVVDPFELINKYGKDAVRYYLLGEVSVFEDTDYSEEHFLKIYNGSLVNGLGNLLSRTLKMISHFDYIDMPPKEALTRFPIRKNINLLGVDQKALSLEELSPSFAIDNFVWSAFSDKAANFDFNHAIQGLWSFLKRLDEYIEDYKPYKMLEDQPDDAKIILWHLAYSLASFALIIKPLLPDTSGKILASLGVIGESKNDWTKFSAKETIHLFPKLEK